MSETLSEAMVTDAQKWLQHMVGERTGIDWGRFSFGSHALTCLHELNQRTCCCHTPTGISLEGLMKVFCNSHCPSGNSELPISNKGTIGAECPHSGYLRFAAGPYARTGM